jgi:hypothetical protein
MLHADLTLEPSSNSDELIGGPQVQAETVRNLDLAASHRRLGAHSRFSKHSPVTESFRLGFRRVNVDAQFHEDRAHFSDRLQDQLLDVISLCAAMNDEPVLQDLDENARGTAARSLIDRSFENSCERFAIDSRAVIGLHSVRPAGMARAHTLKVSSSELGGPDARRKLDRDDEG